MLNTFRLEFEAIGTKWVVDLASDKEPDPRGLQEKIFREIDDFTKIFSRFDEKSKIYLLGQKGGFLKIPPKYKKLIDIYKTLYLKTEGKFTPLVGNLLTDAGYDNKYSLKPGKIKPIKTWDEVIEYQGGILKLLEPAILDFGAGGKGFLTDIIGELLEIEGFSEFTVDASGDILYKSKKNILRVGLEHPENFKQVIGVAEIKNQSICASAGNRRKWGKYHHIFNPETLRSVDDVLAVWVVAPTGLIADSLATALFLTGPESLTSIYDFEYLIVYPDFSFKKSEDFPGEIFYNN